MHVCMCVRACICINGLARYDGCILICISTYSPRSRLQKDGIEGGRSMLFVCPTPTDAAVDIARAAGLGGLFDSRGVNGPRDRAGRRADFEIDGRQVETHRSQRNRLSMFGCQIRAESRFEGVES